MSSEGERFFILSNPGWTLTTLILNHRSKVFRVETVPGQKLSYEGILFLVNDLGSSYQTALQIFEQLVREVNGIEGKCVFISAHLGDRDSEAKLIKDLRLEERGCVWEISFEEQSAKRNAILKFFEQNLTPCTLKPAK